MKEKVCCDTLTFKIFNKLNICLVSVVNRLRDVIWNNGVTFAWLSNNNMQAYLYLQSCRLMLIKWIINYDLIMYDDFCIILHHRYPAWLHMWSAFLAHAHSIVNFWIYLTTSCDYRTGFALFLGIRSRYWPVKLNKERVMNQRGEQGSAREFWIRVCEEYNFSDWFFSWWINVSILDLNEKRILKIMEYWFNCMWIV